MRDQEILDRAERAAKSVVVPDGRFEDLLRRRDRKQRNQRITAGVVGITVFVASVWIVTTGGPFDGTQTPASGGAAPSISVPVAPESSETVEPVGPTPEVDYVIDLNTGVMTPLPEAIIRSLGETAAGRFAESQYAVSPDGSMLAYVGTNDEEGFQIFIAGIDGSGVRQVTHDASQVAHDPTGTTSAPAWSPDSTTIAYSGGALRSLFTLEVATGETRKVTGASYAYDPQFTPDGSELIYTSGSGGNCCPELRTVPVAGGVSTLLVGPFEGLTDSGNGSLSPDGSLVTFLAGGWFTPGSGEPGHHCGPCRFVANADGTEMRVLPDVCFVNPSRAWSPDGSRIVCSGGSRGIKVVDIATGDASPVAEGNGASWLDDHTLLVEV